MTRYKSPTGIGSTDPDGFGQRAIAVSVIIPTYNRAQPLAELLDALRWQTYPNFEVVVVIGPCTDETADTLKERSDIRVVHNPLPNVSVSRNLGAGVAVGELLAFIDDDVIPDVNWLEAAVAVFARDPRVGIASAAVLGQTGRTVDWLHCAVDLYGHGYLSTDGPTHLETSDEHDPGRARTPYVAGANLVVRRSTYDELCGFDDTFRYYLDDTEFCVRAARAGWTIVPFKTSRVHHRFLAGIVRAADDQRTTNWEPILASRAHFAMRYAAPVVGHQRVLDEFRGFCAAMRQSMHEPELLDAFDDHARRAEQLIVVGSAPVRSLPAEGESSNRHTRGDGQLRRLPTFDAEAGRHLVVVAHPDSDALELDAASVDTQRRAARGDRVHFIRPGTEDGTRWAHGVWVHVLAFDPVFSDWAALTEREIDRISRQLGRDLVTIDEQSWPGDSSVTGSTDRTWARRLRSRIPHFSRSVS